MTRGKDLGVKLRLAGHLLLVALPLLTSCGDSPPAATGSPSAAPSQPRPTPATSPEATTTASSSAVPPSGEARRKSWRFPA